MITYQPVRNLIIKITQLWFHSPSCFIFPAAVATGVFQGVSIQDDGIRTLLRMISPEDSFLSWQIVQKISSECSLLQNSFNLRLVPFLLYCGGLLPEESLVGSPWIKPQIKCAAVCFIYYAWLIYLQKNHRISSIWEKLTLQCYVHFFLEKVQLISVRLLSRHAKDCTTII